MGEACRTRGWCDNYGAATAPLKLFITTVLHPSHPPHELCGIDADMMVGNVPSNNVAVESAAKPTESGAAFSLENILGDNHDTLEHPGLKQQELDAATTAAEGWDEESANRPAVEGFCVECEGEWGFPRVDPRG